MPVVGVNRLLNLGRRHVGRGERLNDGVSLSIRGGQAQHETSPQGESISELVHSSDLPGLIGRFVTRTNPESESIRNSPAGERLRTGPAGHGRIERGLEEDLKT